MLSILTSVAMDISLGIAWWVTKQVTYKAVHLIIGQLPLISKLPLIPSLPSLF